MGDTLELTPFHAIEDVGLYYCMVLSETVIVRSCPAYISHASENGCIMSLNCSMRPVPRVRREGGGDRVNNRKVWEST